MAQDDPDRIKAELDYLARLVKGLGDAYAWAHGVGLDLEHGEPIRAQGVSDPVGSVVASPAHARSRSRVQTAARLIRQARVNLQGAQASLNAVLSHGEHVLGEELEPFSNRLISKAELERAKKMQRKRGPSYGIR